MGAWKTVVGPVIVPWKKFPPIVVLLQVTAERRAIIPGRNSPFR